MIAKNLVTEQAEGDEKQKMQDRPVIKVGGAVHPGKAERENLQMTGIPDGLVGEDHGVVVH